jgi:quercetin dioxygenase-like cupin family protein
VTTAPPALTAYVLGRGEGHALRLAAHKLTVKAPGEATGGAFVLYECELGGGCELPLHVHTREEQSVYVLEGRLTFRVGNERIAAEEGSFVLLPRGVSRTFAVEGERARVLLIVSPPGLEELVLELAEAGDTTEPIRAPDASLLAALAARFGIDHDHGGTR